MWPASGCACCMPSTIREADASSRGAHRVLTAVAVEMILAGLKRYFFDNT